MKLCLLEVAMCEKCRSSHFQWEGGVKGLRTGARRGVKNFRTGGLSIWGGTFPGAGSVPHYMPCVHTLSYHPTPSG